MNLKAAILASYDEAWSFFHGSFFSCDELRSKPYGGTNGTAMHLQGSDHLRRGGKQLSLWDSGGFLQAHYVLGKNVRMRVLSAHSHKDATIDEKGNHIETVSGCSLAIVTGAPETCAGAAT